MLRLGHVGMIVGRSAPDSLWKPLSEWLTAQGG
jgi:polyhydroxyalkanoate synthase